MTDQIRIDGGLVLERHQCQWTRVTAQGGAYYRCALSWGDGTPCSSIAVIGPMQVFAQWIWKDEG